MHARLHNNTHNILRNRMYTYHMSRLYRKRYTTCNYLAIDPGNQEIKELKQKAEWIAKQTGPHEVICPVCHTQQSATPLDTNDLPEGLRMFMACGNDLQEDALKVQRVSCLRQSMWGAWNSTKRVLQYLFTSVSAGTLSQFDERIISGPGAILTHLIVPNKSQHRTFTIPEEEARQV